MPRSTVKFMVIIAATLATSVAFAAQRSYLKRLSAPAGGHFMLKTDVGSVTVVGHQGHDVIVHAQVHGSKSFLERLQIHTKQTASGVIVTAHLTDRGWLHWFSFTHDRVRFAITVPRDYPVDLQTSGGELDVRDLHASVRGVTSGGGVQAHNIVGTVNLRTSGGDVEAGHIKGPTQLRTSGGSIRIADSSGTLQLHTSGGDIDIRNDAGRVHALTSGGGIRAHMRLNEGIDLRTSGGNITLQLPQHTHGSLDAAASGGTVTCQLPLSSIQTRGGGTLKGTIGTGGAPINLETSGGDIRIVIHQ